MKYKIFIDKEHEEEILIYAHKKTKLINNIEQLILNDSIELTGYSNGRLFPLNITDIFCFIVEDNKIFAITEKEKLQIKTRLYILEEKLPDNFIKINQSCLANIKLIDRFDASIYGALSVKFKNGYTDYVSRRNIKKVKERLAL